MKLYSFRTFLALLMPILFIVSFTYWNVHEHKTIFTILVRVPLLPKQNETQEEFCWRSRKALFPQIEIPSPIPPGLPHDDTFLVVSIEKDGIIKFNSENFGNLKDTKPLTERLCQIFSERTKFGVYESDSDRNVKAVVIKAPLSIHYGEVVKVVDAAKISGAEPVVLQIDELPQ